MGVTNHVEQALIVRLAVDGPSSVKDLVPTMFGVHLRKHHQLSVGG